MTWDDKANAKLRALWAEGMSTSKIGAALGATKNSVIGQAHRLDLPRRASPIKFKGGTHPGHAAARERKARDIKTAVEMARAGHDAREIAAVLGCAYDTARQYLREGGVVLRSARRRALPVKRDAEAPRAVLVRPVTLGKGTCKWPIGEPRTPSFRYCDAPAVMGKPYCAACCDRAYVKPIVSGLAMMPGRAA